MDGRRPHGVSDELVEALGKTSEASEYLIRARGSLYEFHQLMGHADLLLGDAADALESAGEPVAAERLRLDIVGRNALDGRWTFQVVEEFDAIYYDPAQEHLRKLEEDLIEGRRHVLESELKEQRRSRGRTGHEHRPPSAWSAELETDGEGRA